MSRRPITVLMSAQENHLSLYMEMVQAGCKVILTNSERYANYLEESSACMAPGLDKRMTSWVNDLAQTASTRRYKFSGRDLTKEALTAYYQLMLPTARGMFVVADVIRRIHRDHPIDLCVVHNEEAPNLRMMVTTCKQLGIPTLHVVHGSFYRTEPYWCYHDRIRVDRVVVESELTRQRWFLSKPYNSPEQVVVTGRPEWDALYYRTPPPREAICAKLGLDPSRPTFAIVGTWDSPNLRNRGANTRDALRYAFEAVRSLQGVEPQIAVRPHPGHIYSGTFGPDVYLELAAEFGVEIHLVPGELLDLLDAASVVFTFESTVNGMVMLQKKPLISVINFVVREDDPNWPQAWGQLDGALGCYVDRDMIKAAVETAFCDKDYLATLPHVQQRLMDELNVGNDGRATERIISFMYQMVEEAKVISRPTTTTKEPEGNPLNACTSEGPELAIIGEHTSRFLCIPDWRADGWQRIVVDYLATCRGRRDTVLVVRIEPLLPEMVELAQQVLVAAIEESAIPSDEVPDVVLEATPLDQAQRPGLFRACHYFISADERDPNQAHAKACGVSVVDSLAVAIAASASGETPAREGAVEPSSATFIACDGLLNQRYIGEARMCSPAVIDARAELRQSHLPKHQERPASPRQPDTPKVLISNRDLALASHGERPILERDRYFLVG